MSVLLVVDIQNDFLPGGSLAAENGNKIIPIVNKLTKKFDNVIFTQDWHPKDNISLASNHPGKEPFETIEVSYGEQILWPDHCIQGSRGAQFAPSLDTKNSQLILRKGYRKDIDSYSAFYENDRETPTGLKGYLQDRGLTDVYICGIATDFCVKYSALDGVSDGFNVHVITNAVAGIAEDTIQEAWKEMDRAGVKFVSARPATRDRRDRREREKRHMRRRKKFA